MRLDTATLTYLAEQLADYRDDEQTYWDTIDGETDVMDIVEKIILDSNELDAGAEMNKTLARAYSDRASLLQQRKEALMKCLKVIMLSTGQTKIPHHLATISLRAGVESVVIHNEKDIPSQLCRVTITPDKAEIKKQLKAGVQIDGAELVTGTQTVAIRMK